MGISKLNPCLQGQLDQMNALMLHAQLTQQGQFAVLADHHHQQQQVYRKHTQ